jgi:hypothetical protein
LVGREDHCALASMPLIDDVEEHIRGVGAVREIAHFIDDEDGGLRVGRQRVGQLAGAKRGRQIVDECGRGGEEGIEAVLNGAVRDRDRQVRLAAPRFAGQKSATGPR